MRPVSLPAAEVFGSNASPSPSLKELYQERGARVAEGASDGKSRWGAEEVKRIANRDFKDPGRLEPSSLTSLKSSLGSSNERGTRVVEGASEGKTRWDGTEVNRMASGNVNERERRDPLSNVGFKPLH
jgi:hypothetical protein